MILPTVLGSSIFLMIQPVGLCMCPDLVMGSYVDVSAKVLDPRGALTRPIAHDRGDPGLV